MASSSKGLKFTAPPLSDGEMKHADLQINVESLLDALQLRLNILDANHSLAHMMGEPLKANNIAETMLKDVFQGRNPQFLDFDGNHLDTLISWADLIQEVPVTQFRPVPIPGNDGDGDGDCHQTLMHQCQLETGVVQITDQQLNLFRFFQNNCPLSSIFEDDIKKEEQITAEEATRCDELIKTLASKR